MPQQKQHFNIKQSSVIALFSAVVAQVIAFVPAWAPDKAHIIAGGGIVVSAVFVVANAIHHLASSNTSRDMLVSNALDVMRGELGKIDFNSLVQDAVNAKSLPALEQTVKAEVQRLFSGAFGSGGTSLLAPDPTPIPVVTAGGVPAPGSNPTFS